MEGRKMGFTFSAGSSEFTLLSHWGYGHCHRQQPGSGVRAGGCEGVKVRRRQ